MPSSSKGFAAVNPPNSEETAATETPRHDEKARAAASRNWADETPLTPRSVT